MSDSMQQARRGGFRAFAVRDHEQQIVRDAITEAEENEKVRVATPAVLTTPAEPKLPTIRPTEA